MHMKEILMITLSVFYTTLQTLKLELYSRCHCCYFAQLQPSSGVYNIEKRNVNFSKHAKLQTRFLLLNLISNGVTIIVLKLQNR